MVCSLALWNCGGSGSTASSSGSAGTTFDSGAGDSGVTLASLQSSFGGSCEGDNDGPWSYTQFRGILAEALGTTFTDAQILIIFRGVTPVAGCITIAAACANAVASGNQGLIAGCGGGGGGGGGTVGCTDAAGCSDSWASSTLDSSWTKDNTFNTCVGTFTVTGGSPGNLNFAMSDANGNTCAAQGPSSITKTVASSVTNATFTLTINSWQNINGGSISLMLEPQGGTSTEVGLASTSTYRTCFGGSANSGTNSGNPCDAATSSTPVSFRLVKTGNSVQPYYKIGAGSFVALGSSRSLDNATYNLIIRIVRGMNGGPNFSTVVGPLVVTMP